jgi:hypothetical protein
MCVQLSIQKALPHLHKNVCPTLHSESTAPLTYKCVSNSPFRKHCPTYIQMCVQLSIQKALPHLHTNVCPTLHSESAAPLTYKCVSTHIPSVYQIHVLTWLDTLFCQAAAGCQSELWLWHPLLSLYIWNTVHSETRHTSWPLKHLTLVRFWQRYTTQFRLS